MVMVTKVFDAYIVGAQKAATTALYESLALHSGVDGHPDCKDVPLYTENVPSAKGLEMMSTLGSDERQRLGAEANLTFAPGGVSRLVAANPGVKAIFIVRAPLSRAISSVAYAKQRGLESRSVTKALLEDFAEVREGRQIRTNRWEARQKSYVAHGMYEYDINEIESSLSPSQFMVVSFDDLRWEATKVLNVLQSFLGLPEESLQLERSNVTTGEPHFKKLTALLEDPDKMKYAKTLARQLIGQRGASKLRRAYERHTPRIGGSRSTGVVEVDSGIMEAAERLYQPHLNFLKSKFEVELGLLDSKCGQ